MKTYLRRNFFAIYSGVLTAFVATVLFSGFDVDAQKKKVRFDEITVQRINVVEPDGTLRLVISNKAKAPGIYIKGKERLPGHHGNDAGLIFLNDEGTENGGLTFNGAKDQNGNVFSSGHLSFDRYLQDQILTFTARQENEQLSASFNVLDRPAWSIEEYLDLLDRIANLPPDQQRAEITKFLATHPVGARRIRLGSSTDRSVSLELKDAEGKDRIILKVDPDGTPRLQFLNANGQVVSELPQRN